MVQDDAKSELLFYRWAPHGILYSSGTEDKVAADKEAKFWPTNQYTFSPPVCIKNWIHIGLKSVKMWMNVHVCSLCCTTLQFSSDWLIVGFFAPMIPRCTYHQVFKQVLERNLKLSNRQDFHLSSSCTKILFAVSFLFWIVVWWQIVMECEGMTRSKLLLSLYPAKSSVDYKRQ